MLADGHYALIPPETSVAMKEQGNHVYTCSMRHGYDTSWIACTASSMRSKASREGWKTLTCNLAVVFSRTWLCRGVQKDRVSPDHVQIKLRIGFMSHGKRQTHGMQQNNDIIVHREHEVC